MNPRAIKDTRIYVETQIGKITEPHINPLFAEITREKRENLSHFVQWHSHAY